MFLWKGDDEPRLVELSVIPNADAQHPQEGRLARTARSCDQVAGKRSGARLLPQRVQKELERMLAGGERSHQFGLGNLLRCVLVHHDAHGSSVSARPFGPRKDTSGSTSPS